MEATATTDLASLRAQFPITAHSIYMDHAAVCPISKKVRAAMHSQTAMQCNDITSAGGAFEQCYREARSAIARLVGSRADRVTFIQNTSHGLSLIANGQAWQPGDNLVVPAMEFPSNFLPWLRFESKGVEIRRLHVPDGRVTPESLRPLVDDRIRVVALSAVQYYNGYRPDLAAISEIAESRDALLVVDGTQATGAIGIEVSAFGIDALVVSAHKWMLGPLGIGFMALSDRLLDRTEVTQVGWLSVDEPFEFRRELDLLPGADRFEPGTENSVGLFGLRERLTEIEQYGALRIEERILDLTELMAQGLDSRGFSITSPRAAGERSGILTFRHEGLDPEPVVETLKQERVFLSARHGSFRASPHYYNSEEEVEAVITEIGGMVDRT